MPLRRANRIKPLQSLKSDPTRCGRPRPRSATTASVLWRLFQFREGTTLFARRERGPANGLLRRCSGRTIAISRSADSAKPPTSCGWRWHEWPSRMRRPPTRWRGRWSAIIRPMRPANMRKWPTPGPLVWLGGETAGRLDRRAGDSTQAATRLRNQLSRYPGGSDWSLRYELAAVLDRLGQYDDGLDRALSGQDRNWRRLDGRAPRGSYFVRRRQWELTQSVTSADLRRWRQAGDRSRRQNASRFCPAFPFGHNAARTDHRLQATPSIPTNRASCNGQFLSRLVWKADDAWRHHRIAFVRPEQLVAGVETFYQLTENYLDQPIGERLLIEKNPLQTADLPLPLRLFPEVAIARRAPRPARRRAELSVTMVPLNWIKCAGNQRRRGVPLLCRHDAALAVVADRLDWPAHEISYERLIAEPPAKRNELPNFSAYVEPAMLDERQRSERKAVRTPTYVDVTKPLYTARLAAGRTTENTWSRAWAIIGTIRKIVRIRGLTSATEKLPMSYLPCMVNSSVGRQARRRTRSCFRTNSMAKQLQLQAKLRSPSPGRAAPLVDAASPRVQAAQGLWNSGSRADAFEPGGRSGAAGTEQRADLRHGGPRLTPKRSISSEWTERMPSSFRHRVIRASITTSVRRTHCSSCRSGHWQASARRRNCPARDRRRGWNSPPSANGPTGWRRPKSSSSDGQVRIRPAASSAHARSHPTAAKADRQAEATFRTLDRQTSRRSLGLPGLGRLALMKDNDRRFGRRHRRHRKVQA